LYLDTSPNAYIKNGYAVFLGQQGSSPPGAHSSFGLRENEALEGLVQYSHGADFQFKATTQVWPSPDFRDWGVEQGSDGSLLAICDQGPTSGLKRISTDVLSPSLAADHWYYIVLWVRSSTEFTARVWDKDDPGVFAEKDWHMTADWAGRKWYLQMFATAGTVEMDQYWELRLAPQP